MIGMPETTASGGTVTQQLSQIMYSVSINDGLKNRIEALARDRYWNGTGDPSAELPINHIAWAVATNPTILYGDPSEGKTGVIERIEDGNIVAAVDGIDEEHLKFVVGMALTRLQPIEPTAEQ